MEQFQRGNTASHRGEDGEHSEIDIIGDEDSFAVGLTTLEGHGRVCLPVQEMKELGCCHNSMVLVFAIGQRSARTRESSKVSKVHRRGPIWWEPGFNPLVQGSDRVEQSQSCGLSKETGC